MANKVHLDRRRFIKISSLAGAGILFSFYLSGCDEEADTSTSSPVGDSPTPTDAQIAESQVEISLFVRISSNGQVTITIPRPDVGQGSRTAMAMIVAEEMGAHWDDVRVEQAPSDPRFGNQVTGGSLGISDSYRILREAGAVVREVFLAAAAEMWDVTSEECMIENGVIRHPGSEQECGFSHVLDIAAEIEPPASYDVVLKDPSDFQIIGTCAGNGEWRPYLRIRSDPGRHGLCRRRTSPCFWKPRGWL
jgi:CO/xanthine dehydrogenase Mo-binding subunit